MNARKRVYSVAGHRRKEVLVAGKIWSRERFGRGKDLGEGKIWSRERFGRGKDLVAGKIWSRERFGRGRDHNRNRMRVNL